MLLSVIMFVLGVIAGGLVIAAIVGRKIVLTIEEIARNR
jgi:hypothetical protein